MIAYDFLDVVLEDDCEVPHGGVAFLGETLRDFVDELDVPYSTEMVEINKMLTECGIKPINV